MNSLSTRIETFRTRASTHARVDLGHPHPHPSPGRFSVATATALAGSLLAVGLLVRAATEAFPSTRGYEHFQVADYATLTAVGVLVASASWPVVTLVSSSPRWLFLRLAVAVTVLAWIPDLVLLADRDPSTAVACLMVMHGVVAVVTYQSLVRLAPATVEPPASVPADPDRLTRYLATALALLIGVELVLGVVTLVAVPTGRPTGWVPPTGVVAYGVHALLGLVLAVGAVLFASRARLSSRILRLTAWIGGLGVALAGVGGILTVSHPLRLVGIVFMLIGTVGGGFGYVLPLLDRLSDDSPAPSPR